MDQLVSLDLQLQAGASADDDSDELLISPEDEQIYKDSEAVIKPSQRPRDKAMIQKVRHFKFGHHGPCPGGCDICKQTSGTLRKVISGGTPSFDDKAGRTFGMDSLYWDVESRHGLIFFSDGPVFRTRYRGIREDDRLETLLIRGYRGLMVFYKVSRIQDPLCVCVCVCVCVDLYSSDTVYIF